MSVELTELNTEGQQSRNEGAVYDGLQTEEVAEQDEQQRRNEGGVNSVSRVLAILFAAVAIVFIVLFTNQSTSETNVPSPEVQDQDPSENECSLTDSCDEPIIDKDIIACDYNSRPTVCSSPVSSINCDLLLENVNTCTALVANKPGESCIYDPNNCSNNKTALGCNAGGYNDCRYCGFSPYKDCQYGDYATEYACPCDFSKSNTLDDVLAIPVQINCTKFYASLDKIQNQGCPLTTTAFKLFAKNPGTLPNQKCPPRVHQLLMSYGADKGFQSVTTRNSKDEVWPKLKSNQTCELLALGQESSFGDAGEIATIEITAKTMAMRMLKPATYTFSEPLLNCCDIQCDINYTEHCTNCDRCEDTASYTIENYLTWKNHSNMTKVPYQYQVP